MLVSGINSLLDALARQGADLAAIAENTYVAPADAEGPPPASGLLAPLAERPVAQGGGARGIGATGAEPTLLPPALEEAGQVRPESSATRSLVGLRPPSAAAARDEAAVARPSAAFDPAGLDDRPRGNEAARAPASPLAPGGPSWAPAADPSPPDTPQRPPDGPDIAAEPGRAQAIDDARPAPDRPAQHRAAEHPGRPRDEAGRVRDTAAAAVRDAPDAAPRLAREAVPALVASAADGFGLHADAGPPQTERAGVIASFVLNAAMIPGWPPPRPFAMPEADALLAGLARGAMPAGEPVLALLQRRGAGAGALARLRQTLARLVKSRRLRVLLGLTALTATIEALLDAVEAELGRLARGDGREEERPGEEARWRLSV